LREDRLQKETHCEDKFWNMKEKEKTQKTFAKTKGSRKKEAGQMHRRKRTIYKNENVNGWG